LALALFLCCMNLCIAWQGQPILLLLFIQTISLHCDVCFDLEP
jgi:hypothetical protein